MRNPVKSKMLIIICLLACLTAAFLPGCIFFTTTPDSVPVSEFSLTGVWEEIMEATGMQGNSVNLELFEVRFKENTVKSYSTEFYGANNEGIIMHFSVGTDLEGKLRQSGGEIHGEIPDRIYYDPSAVFGELDGFGLESIIDGAESAGIRIHSQFGDEDYKIDDLFRIEAGKLLPIHEISFHSDVPWAAVQVIRYYPHEPDSPFYLNSLRSNNIQRWFIKEDLEKAAAVEYLRNRQGPEFESIIAGIYNALPQGWEMEVMTQEGFMGPPHGLGEPLFRLDFEDPNHQFFHSFRHLEGQEYQPYSPSLRLFFYDIQEKEAVLEIIEQQKIYSWDIPDYFAETPEYIVVTSPLYINSGCFTDEAMALFEPLDKVLKDYFDVKSGYE